ncbi:MAG: ABC transporter permease, partial [Methylobacter sp.]|nr:ABC transporter permease [Methylobacter sp.]
MYYSRFKNNEKLALTIAAIAWVSSLAYGWVLALSVVEGLVVSGVERMIMPSLLTLGAALSITWWRKSRSADQQLLAQLLRVSQEWAQG